MSKAISFVDKDVNKNICLKPIVLGLLFSFLLQGCSSYRNKFACDPATGANCRSVEEIHAMLENGKIWELNARQEKSKGKSKSYNSLQEVDRIASRDGILKVWIPENYRMQEYRDGQYWYLPTQGLQNENRKLGCQFEIFNPHVHKYAPVKSFQTSYHFPQFDSVFQPLKCEIKC